MSTCKHGKIASDEILDAIHEGQEGAQRHKCTECAFDVGFQYGRQYASSPTGGAECTYTNKRAPKAEIDALPESQAGKGRHKCAVCAYHEGFNVAREQAIGKKIGDDVAKPISGNLKS